ncbi:hypothetical protein [Lysobacter tyrosinilyticus]
MGPQPFECDDTDDRADEAAAAFDESDDELAAEGFEDAEAYDDAMGEEVDGLEADASDLAAYGEADAYEAAAYETVDDGFEDAAEDEVETAWLAFEDDVADALDVDGTDEFLGALIGGLSRAAGTVARHAPTAARWARRAGGVARGAGQVASGIGQLSQSASTLARWFGAPGAARSLRNFGTAARGAGRLAGGAAGALDDVAAIPRHARRVRDMTASAAGANSPIMQLLQQIGSLSSEGADEFEAFDAMADLYEDGVDEALPAAVGLAARAAARALGWKNTSQLSQAARRALVRGIATAARTLVNRQGAPAVRALPRIAQAATRVAKQRQVPPGQIPRVVSRTVPRIARQTSRNPRAVRQLARPMSQTDPHPSSRPTSGALSRPNNIGRGSSGNTPSGVRRYRFHGPIELTIRTI